MTDERLSRHLQQENADLKSENSRLRMQTDTQETKLQEKDSEVLRLLNQIATDMIRKSDVDRLVEEAVAKAELWHYAVPGADIHSITGNTLYQVETDGERGSYRSC